MTPTAEAASEEPCVALLAEIRFACGDNGTRMQPELVEFIRELALNSARYLYLRDGSPDDGPEWERAYEALWHAADGRELDHAIDTARREAAAGHQECV